LTKVFHINWQDIMEGPATPIATRRLYYAVQSYTLKEELAYYEVCHICRT